MIPRRIDDRGGGLARVGGRLRLLEGLAQPREETEFALQVLQYADHLGADRRPAPGLPVDPRRPHADPAKVAAAVRTMAARVPTYVTIKDVKRRWGHGQEDVFPVAQFEKLWGDLTSLPDLACALRRRRSPARPAAQGRRPARRLGQRWQQRDHVESLCDFPKTASREDRENHEQVGLVLVTGGAGFIGSHLVEALLEQGYRVRVVDNLSTGHRRNLGRLEGRYEWLEGDLAEFEVCRGAVEGVEARLSRSGDPQRPASDPRAARVARERADGHAQPARSGAAGRGSAASSSPRRAAPTARLWSCPSTRRSSPVP